MGMNPRTRKNLGPTNLGLGYERMHKDNAGQSSPPPLPPSCAEEPFSPSPTLEDQIHDLTTRFDAY